MRLDTTLLLPIALCGALLVGGPRAARALGPHEIAVLVNTNSAASLRVAEAFAAARQVPEQNIVFLDAPVPSRDAPASLSVEQFRARIWVPTLRALREKGVGEHVLAWVYSVGFPAMVETQPPMSITGMTFVRGTAPDHDTINAATYASPFFGGPDHEGGSVFSAQTFDMFSDWLGCDMPIPAMMLGFIGRNGNREEDVIRCLRNGVKSNGGAPSGTVCFVTSADVRSVCRQWQFGQARHLLERAGVRAMITNGMPGGDRPLLGLMMGSETVKPAGLNLVPGAMAEHLTSAAAEFHSDAQTKLTAWIAAGATASSGAVTEPFANWKKFPSASFYVYYAGGCTMVESFYQSIRCPLQILPVGDPLAQPWMLPGSASMAGLPDGPLRGTVRLTLSGVSADGSRAAAMLLLVDGRAAGTGASVEWDTAKVADGTHTLRVVAYGRGMARPQWFAERIVKVLNGAGGS